jgi:tetrahydromethanopterin S-methyltransferase subunit A
MSTDGYDDAKKKLDELSNKMKEIASQKEVSFIELYPDDFVSRYTYFQTLQQMFDAIGIEDAEEIHSAKWTEFVAAHSRFAGWEEMQ